MVSVVTRMTFRRNRTPGISNKGDFQKARLQARCPKMLSQTCSKFVFLNRTRKIRSKGQTLNLTFILGRFNMWNTKITHVEQDDRLQGSTLDE